MLRHNHGVKTGDIVGIEAHRSVHTPLLLLAVLKAGAAYLPLDPTHPVERLHVCIAEATPRLVVIASEADKDSALEAACARQQCLVARLHDLLAAPPPADGRLPSDVSPDSLAYVLYTSGSTGPPKGVAVTHRNVVGFLRAMQLSGLKLETSDIVSCVHSLLFDFSVWEIFGALASGAALVMVTRDIVLSPPDLINLLRSTGVTVFSQTPAAFMVFMMEEKIQARKAARSKGTALTGRPMAKFLPDLRAVCFAGDKMQYSRLRKWFARYGDDAPKLFNCYGITETAVFSTCKRIRTQDTDIQPGSSSPIGVRLINNVFVVLNQAGQLAPASLSGELWIGGPCVAEGYLRRDKLTKSRFIDLGKRLGIPELRGTFFKTGDLVKFDEVTKEFDYLGRSDQQLKVRGFRVEPFEIEQGLMAHPRVQVAVAILMDSPAHLVAFCVLHEQAGASDGALEEELREFVGTKVPAYMVPQRIILLDEIPVTPNRKTDRKALAAWKPPTVQNTPRDFVPSKRLASHARAAAARPAVTWEECMASIGWLQGARPIDNSVGAHRSILPKFAYPSGGSLYSVRTYLLLSDDVAGVPASLNPPAPSQVIVFYYNPLRDSLYEVRRVSRDRVELLLTLKGSGLVLIGHVAAVEPIYPGGGEYFTRIEAGCICELLQTHHKKNLNVSSVPVPEHGGDTSLSELFDLNTKEHDLLRLIRL